MDTTKSNYTGVVVDEPQGKALLYYAIKEKLVDDDRRIGDGFVKRILSEPPLAEVKDSAFEQLVLGGRIYVPFWLPNDWKGELFEKELIISAPRVEDEDKVTIEALNPSIILSMLNSRGIIWSESDLSDKYLNYLEKYEEWEDGADGISYNAFVMYEALKGLMPMSEKFTPLKMDKWNTLQAAYQVIKPAIEVIEAYKTVITSSINLSALSALPVGIRDTGVMNIENVDDTVQKEVMIKITSSELGRTPVGYNLSQTIQIAESPEAGYFRDKLDQWSSVLRSRNDNKFEQIYTDVKRSRKELGWSKMLEISGGFCTCIGIPATFFTPIVPPLGALGFGVTILGGICFSSQKAIEFRNRWAMFGKG